MKNLQTQRGYTLLFAVLTATLVLAVAAFITGIARKQFILSATARDSIYALYAADSGIECALQSGIVDIISTSIPPAAISCAGVASPLIVFISMTDKTAAPKGFDSLKEIWQAPVQTGAQDVIRLRLPYTDTPSHECIIYRFWKGTDTFGNPRTVIESRGYNVCDATGLPAESPRTVERAIRVSQ